MRALTNVLLLAFLVSALLALFALFGLGAFSYYVTPLARRGYLPMHRLLRPSGRVGEAFGIAGLVLMLTTLLYAARKKSRALTRIGSTKRWLEVHIFCGIVGPVLITLHTSFKFNGIVSIAYWSMLLVVLSGFVGRYLYVRIPKTIRGAELSLDELETRAVELKTALAEEGLRMSLLRKIEAFEAEASAGGFLLGDWRLGRGLRRLHRELAAAGISAARLRTTDALIRERAVLLRRVATLETSKKLFQLWHVFHKPFVYVMLAIALLHVAVALFFGYAMAW